MNLRLASIAVNRFGLGARPGELRTIAADPRGWLKAQIGAASPPIPIALAPFPGSAEIVRTTRERRDQTQGDDQARQAMQRQTRQEYVREMAQRYLAGATTEHPFRERLVRFWSNHLCVSVSRNEIRGLVGSYEREAIRPRLGGSFEQLLLSAEQHPAMLIYLDSVRSVGPRSVAGQRADRGLNENHAREILELHTLGVDGGYSQDDVEALARILTGWGLVARRQEVTGQFQFEELRHEPGPKQMMGRTYPMAGEREGRDALRHLARHPRTARFLATKLARHFVADDPPESAIQALTTAFRDADGDLPTVHAALVDLPEAWSQTHSKLKTPEELILSTARGLDYQSDGEPMLRSARYLGQLPLAAPSPQGWPDQAASWLGPEAVLSRVDWAGKVGEDTGSRIGDPVERAVDLLGPLLTDRTRQGLALAPNPSEAVALLVASPEFQRR